MTEKEQDRQAVLERALGDELVQLLDERKDIEVALAHALLHMVCQAAGVESPVNPTTPTHLVGMTLAELLERRRNVEGTLYVTFVDRIYSAHRYRTSEPQHDPPTPGQ